MTSTLPDVDVEFEHYLKKIELCQIQDERKGGCGAIATHELIVRCRNEHEYEILACNHHKIIACGNGLACRKCRAEADPEWAKWAVRVEAVWERHASK